MWEDDGPELDPAFVQRDQTRKAGLPVQIAETRRLLIREIVMEDVPRLFAIFRQPGIASIVEPAPTLEEEQVFMRAYISHAYAFYDYGLWCVLEKESGKVIGEAGLFPSERVRDAVEMGYVIAKEYQRKGYGAECARAVLEYAFHTLDLEEVHLFAAADNQASLRTAHALGFCPAGHGAGEGKLTHLICRQEGNVLETLRPW